MDTNPAKLSSKIIDRTLPEIYPLCARISRLDTLDFCWMLKSAGVDIIEISSEMLSRIGKLPEGLEFIVRTRSPADIERCINNHVKRIVLGKSLLADGPAEMIRAGGLEAALEMRVNSIDGIYRLEQLENNRSFAGVSCIRILGLDAVSSNEWLAAARKIRDITGKRLDICTGNRFFTAVSTVLEGMTGGMDFVTASFNGFGCFAPLEELLAALKVHCGGGFKADLGVLPKLSSFVTAHTRRKIPAYKPVIGDRIFVYESGIHAAAIDKNPAAYEPFEPSVVGRKRELAVGKHSGRYSVLKKLSQLGLDVSRAELSVLLEQVRDMSIRNGRSLENEELLDIYRGSGNIGH
jgi:homocitrate synthase NifV